MIPPVHQWPKVHVTETICDTVMVTVYELLLVVVASSCVTFTPRLGEADVFNALMRASLRSTRWGGTLRHGDLDCDDD